MDRMLLGFDAVRAATIHGLQRRAENRVKQRAGEFRDHDRHDQQGVDSRCDDTGEHTDHCGAHGCRHCPNWGNATRRAGCNLLVQARAINLGAEAESAPSSVAHVSAVTAAIAPAYPSHGQASVGLVPIATASTPGTKPFPSTWPASLSVPLAYLCSG